ncbi:transcriptional regulator [Desulfitobacterium dichloroeliminans LMG P-21439]|uniref:Transcriptional regulator n=1 Tax=Desulfitobacterium dichloroeliminans (strain LMG P-21439 / DCA1) TaxID=871963 RepID=L0F4P3_DESDL|nr:TetR/AcrR family transcriptional regulator [Desulfitobacterium dichloroeliminans]AGA67913.1 transcriptional regulator [Desulfitobacterium dichloroeliminans LMG P-21439]
MRVIKEYDERRSEILDAAERLFHAKGYDKSTVNDILNEVGIAKGTFYYYFKSKEDVLDAIVERVTEVLVSRAQGILEKSEFSPEEKLMHTFLAMRVEDQVNGELLDELHKGENALLHQKSLHEMVTVIAPVLVEIIEEGIEKKVWSCRYPLEYMQIFLVSTLTLTDEGIFPTDDADAQGKMMVALIAMLERMLNVPEDYFTQMYLQNWG